MNGNTKKAILFRLNVCKYDWFFIGHYFYKLSDMGMLWRRPQEPGRLATSNWERVPVKWDGKNWTF